MTELVRDYWVLAVLIAVAVFAVAFWFGNEAPVARRVFTQFGVYIALPLFVVVGAFLFALASTTDLDERIWQAIIAGLVIATGWLTTAIFNELGKAQGKAERMRDYHKAIFAEISNALEVFWANGEAEAYAEALVERMREDGDFVPLIPREHHDFIYNSLVDEIEVLPRQTIDPIVAYYSLIKGMNALAEDMRGEMFRASEFSQTRRIAMYQDYFETRRRAFEVGKFARNMILEYAASGAAGADAYAQRLNSRDADRTGPSPGSE